MAGEERYYPLDVGQKRRKKAGGGDTQEKKNTISGLFIFVLKR